MKRARAFLLPPSPFTSRSGPEPGLWPQPLGELASCLVVYGTILIRSNAPARQVA